MVDDFFKELKCLLFRLVLICFNRILLRWFLKILVNGDVIEIGLRFFLGLVILDVLGIGVIWVFFYIDGKWFLMMLELMIFMIGLVSL